MLKNKYLAIFLSIVALIVIYFSFVKGFIMKRQARPVHKPIQKVEEKYEPPVREIIDLNNPFNIDQISHNPDEEWGRDPFPSRPPIENEEGEFLMEELPKLTAIVRDNNRILAILNGKVVKEGEKIDGILVKKILANSVIIDRGVGEERVYIFNLQKGGQFEKNK